MSLRQLWQRLRPQATRHIPDALWQATLAATPFLADHSASERQQLRLLCCHFLGHKEFHGAHGLQVSDAMAVAIAAQACLPLLHFGAPAQALAWYGDFVSIVLHATDVVAQREVVDAAGVVHHWREVLSGEAMERGPLMLNWHDVANAGVQAQAGSNLVIHEFIHKIDMRSGSADGCPPLPQGFLGTTHAAAARRAWFAVLEPAYAQLREQVTIAERFGGAKPWLDAYGAESMVEFFAVACEAYFVNRRRFSADFATLTPLFDAFFQRPGRTAPPPAL